MHLLMYRSLSFDEVLRPVTPFLRLGTPTVLVLLATFPWSTRVD
jgi:hypothetical protein